MIKFLISLALVGLTSLASAQPCMPKSAITPSAPGGELVIVGGVLDDAAAVGMWCPSDINKCQGLDATGGCWRTFMHPWLHKHATPQAQVFVARVMAAPASQWTQVASDAITATKVVPLVGSRDECKLQQVTRRLCEAMTTQATSGMGAGFTTGTPQCGAVKDCSTVPETPVAAPSYIVSRASMAATATTRPAYNFANGVRGTAATIRAVLGSSCDCSVGVVEGSSRYCAHDAAKVTVALCVAAP